MIAKNGPANRGSTKTGAILKLTLQECLKKHKDTLGIQRPRGIRTMCSPHNPTHSCLLRCSKTTPWRWQILQRIHKPTEHRSSC